MLQELTAQVMQGRHLSEPQAEAALELMLHEETPDVPIASFLSALAMKGEHSDEIAGFARVMRNHVVTIRSKHTNTVDTAGTGGGLDTFNISTTAAFVIAGAGLPVAKHGNRAITSRCGSADLLSALGINISASVELAEYCLNEIGLTFMFAPFFHPSMKRVAAIRREIGHRTVFNLLGPLTNPASAPFQIVGVYSPALTEKLAQALAQLNCRRAWVVHSHDGLDELSTGAPARVSDIGSHGTRTFDFDPAQFGLRPADWSSLRGGTPEQNAEITKAILCGKSNGAARDVVVLNAAAAIHLASDMDFCLAIKKAEESIDTGAAMEKVELLRKACA
ncbi:MAG: anthranilate phosphoribosyltransferase [Acidobacteria bacterium]|nr:MAG: anthranilate phosphoribosyltransferase [Acidobacteriota bacterium]